MNVRQRIWYWFTNHFIKASTFDWLVIGLLLIISGQTLWFWNSGVSSFVDRMFGNWVHVAFAFMTLMDAFFLWRNRTPTNMPLFATPIFVFTLVYAAYIIITPALSSDTLLALGCLLFSDISIQWITGWRVKLKVTAIDSSLSDIKT